MIVDEAESAALAEWLGAEWLGAEDRGPVCCDLVRAELIRTVRRAAPDRVVRAREVLDSLTLTHVTRSTSEEAGRLDPTVLRTPDVVHLAAALDLGDDLEAMVTYDGRLADAARANGVIITAPG